MIKTKLFLFFIFVLCGLNLVDSLGATVSIPKGFGDVSAGEQLHFIVDVMYPEQVGRSDLRFDYKIIQGGKVLISGQSVRAIETRMSFVDVLTIPSNAYLGNYELVVGISNSYDIDEFASTSFYLSKGQWGVTILHLFIFAGISLSLGVLLGIDIVVHRRLLFMGNARRSSFIHYPLSSQSWLTES
ncbi:MAG: hypothetical protein ACI83O_000948 [Patescibacteria group bacterium]|jgi:hypothetical protein